MARFFSLVPEAAAIAIFAITYLVLAVGRLPGFRLDRAGAALVGASLMMTVGRSPRRSTSIRSSCCWGDDRRRQSAPRGLLPPRQRLGRHSRPVSGHAVDGCHFG